MHKLTGVMAFATQGAVHLAHTLFFFAIALGILVAVHEFGHYLAARLCGFHIEAFSIGFGRPIASWTDKHDTRWQIGWLPLGGYVKLHGQVRPEDMSAEERLLLRPGQGFHDRSLIRRAIVIVAGPLANFVLAIAVFTAVTLAAGQPFYTPLIGDITPGQAGAKAGLLTGDKVLAIDGAPIATFADIQRIVVSHPGTLLHMRVQRGASQLTLPVTPDAHATPAGAPTGRLGVSSGALQYRPVGPLAAIGDGFSLTWDTVRQTALGLWQIFSGQRSPSELGGVIKIAQISGQAASLGIVTFAQIIALLSVNLGLLNLLPIPVLDGGYLVLYAVEAVRGRPLPARIQDYGFRLGLGLILTLMVLVNGHDLLGTPLFRWMAHLIG
jgi:regulator of sigma E protease